MKILITGATGTLGKYLIPALLADGHELIHLGRSRLPLEHPHLHWETRELSQEPPPKIFAGVEVVLHFANLTKESPALDQTVAKHLFRAAESAGVATFFYASSIRVYGHRLGALDETSAPAPCAFDDYGKGKLATERALGELAAASATRLRLLRIGHVLTPENIGKSPRRLGLPFLLLWGRAFPHYIGIADTAEALLFLVGRHRHLQFSVFHLTRDDQNARFLDLYAPLLPTWQRWIAAAGALPLPLPYLLCRRATGARETRCARIRSGNLTSQGWVAHGPHAPLSLANSFPRRLA